MSNDVSSSVLEDEQVVLNDDTPRPFSQNELNELVRDFSLLKSSTEPFASRLKE